MHYFRYKNNNLYCEDVRVSRIVRKFGSPCYIYSYRTLIEHFRKLKNAFKEVNPLICYSVKANSNLSICRALVREGAGLDVVSGGELFRALKIRTNPRKIVFAGVGKTDREIRQAIKAGILFFNVESEAEIERIQQIAIKLRKSVNVCLRVNPEVNPHTHKYIKTAKKESKFGLSFSIARNIILNRQRYFNVHIKGLHIHIGSQITQTRPFVHAVRKVSTFIKEMGEHDVRFEYLNIGGGMGIVYKKEMAKTADIFARDLVPMLKKLNLKIILEPGRFIVGSAGILVSRVTHVKKTESKRFVILDCGMNDLIRPSLYEAYHDILPLNKASSRLKNFTYDVVGPICETGDFLAKARSMPQVESGQHLAIMGAGAYGFTMSSNYNSRLRAVEILVKGKRCFLIRKRETYYDLIKKERIPKTL